MDKKKLQEYQAIKEEYAEIELDLIRLESTMLSPKGQILTGMPGAKGYQGNALDDKIDPHTQLLELYREKKAALAAARLEIEQAIWVLDTTERRLIRRRYFDGQSWEDVGKAIGYSVAQTHRIHGQALNKLRAAEKAEG